MFLSILQQQFPILNSIEFYKIAIVIYITIEVLLFSFAYLFIVQIIFALIFYILFILYIVDIIYSNNKYFQDRYILYYINKLILYKVLKAFAILKYQSFIFLANINKIILKIPSIYNNRSFLPNTLNNILCLFLFIYNPKIYFNFAKKPFLYLKDHNYNRFYFIREFSIIVNIVKVVF